ncbi:cation:proton antiporter [Spirochaeta isovalerica]|uniref:Kef-type K+ transport system membrane component KefB n=1 Tax=Spirochaeta isovalerica TaxID=150 RepID=A0A841R9N0_9SPIO|nr:cation:proton antiporter [Spirochaeta isovalerica]MBB6482054.1 Kef-type K+ transport system membrane component KefB [Spirochaeta isovalerica]
MNLIIEDFFEFKELLSQHSLFIIGLLLVFGYFLGKLADKVKLPEITGYIISGLLMGDAVFQMIPHDSELTIVTDVALALIALTIGGEFSLSKLKVMGREVMILTIFQILLTYAVVSISLVIFKLELPFALLMGAIATATAPAATVAIVQSLRAHGRFIDRLYGIVAMDDAGAVIVFSVSFAIATGMLSPREAASGHGASLLIFHAFTEIVFSLLLGALFGFFIHKSTRKHTNTGEILILTLALVLLETALALFFHLSPLLSNMAAGAVLINISPRNHRIFRTLEPLSPPVYALFFIIAGTELNPSALMKKEILLLGAVFIVSRAIAKYSGINLGARAAGSAHNIRKYLGFCMLPQAGVAIGLVLMIQTSPVILALPEAEQATISLMVNIVLLSVFFNELTGPPLSKFAIIHAMEEE